MSNTGESFKTKGYRGYALGALTLVYTFNFIDRMLINVVSRPIIDEFGLSNFQFSLLAGFGFALFYTILGIPIARLSERYNRVRIIAFCTILWSIATVLCGFTIGFITLLLARIAVGIGEAGCSPPANSLIADMFKAKDRPAALGIYAAGVSIGLVLANLGGGLLLKTFSWREIFIIVGLPGAVLGLIVWITLKEPIRGYSNDPNVPLPKMASLGQAMKELATNKTYWLTILAASTVAFGGYALVSYETLFIQYKYSVSPSDAAIFFMAVITVGSVIGTIGGGYIIKHFSKKNILAPFQVPAIGLILSLPLMLTGFWVDNKTVMVICFFCAAFSQNFYASAQLFIPQSVVNVELRATSIAILLFAANVLGLGIGMSVFAYIADLAIASKLPELAGGDKLSVKCSLADPTLSETLKASCQSAKAYGQQLSLSLAACVVALASLFFLWASRYYEQDRVT